MFRKGDLILLLGPRKYLMRCEGQFVCKYGKYDLRKLYGKREGCKIQIGKARFTAVKPYLTDFLFNRAARGPQVVLPKDAAAIVAQTGAGAGWKVVDAGAGSAFLALFLANIGCNVTTYEKRKEFYARAARNIRESGLKVKIRHADITKGIHEKNLDLVVLDLEESEKVVPLAYNALKPGGWLAIFVLHTERIPKLAQAIRKAGFNEIKVKEAIERPWQVELHGRKSFTRPRTQMLAHTGFLIFARKY